MLSQIAQQRRPDQKRQIAGRGDNAHARRRVGTGIAGGGNGQREAERSA